MTALALRGLLARRARALLTVLAVLLGVTMIAGTFVFTDTINRSFTRLFTSAVHGADAIVSAKAGSADRLGSAPAVRKRLIDEIRRLPGVQRAEGQVSDRAELVGAGGKLLHTGLSGTIATSYLAPPFGELQLIAGRPPRGSHQVLLDAQTAADLGYRIGQRIEVATELPVRAFRIVGLVRFGGVAQAGFSVVAFDLRTAQRLFAYRSRYDAIYIAGKPSVAPSTLTREIAPLLTPELVVRTAAAQAATNTDRLRSGLSFLTDALLAFGLIAVFVGAFVIFNTFSITVAQRTREFGLLRTLGASRRQLLGSVALEALTIGVGASALAIVLGFAAAAGLRALFNAFGFQLPSTGAVLELRTVVVCLFAGVSVTLLASLAPALRATRVPPLAAMREGIALPSSRLAPALPWLAALLSIAGVAMALRSATSGSGVGMAAAGAVAVVVGVALLAPRLVPATARAAGWPLERATALTGRLARENAARNPARTAATAAALMVGLALVLFVTIFANEARASIRAVVARSFAGDLAITGQSAFAPIPDDAARVVRRVPGVQVASILKTSDSTVTGAGSWTANGIDTQTLTRTYNFDWVAGDDSLLGQLGPSGALVEQSLAQRADLQVGSHFEITTPAGKVMELTTIGIYRDTALLAGYAVALRKFDFVFHQPWAQRILVKLLPTANPMLTERHVGAALRKFPQTSVQSERQLADQEAARLNSVLYLFYALLALSVIVSMFGIVNTLTLSIHERRRELGTLRALGASRRTLRRMVRYESAITALIGSSLGLVLGIFFAAVVTASLAGTGFHFAVPWLQVAGLLVLSLLLALAAAAAPARRAARLDVLAAIAYE